MLLRSIRHALVAAAVVFVPISVVAQESRTDAESDHLDRTTKIVGIGPSRLVPSVLVVPHEAAFGRLNYTSRDARIGFAEDITGKLTCRSPGPFRPTGRDVASPRIASGAFVTLCSLAPGEYDYRVDLEGSAQPLLGKLVVEGGV